MDFVTRLKELMDWKGITLGQLAEASGLSLATVRAYARGGRAPGSEAARSLARALGVAVSELALFGQPLTIGVKAGTLAGTLTGTLPGPLSAPRIAAGGLSIPKRKEK
jgi:transcriptional regulator with XRE-family HTH domain